AFPLARDLERYRLEYFEQPMPAGLIGESARLRRQTKTPVALNQAVTTPGGTLPILPLGAAGGLPPGPHPGAGRPGGEKGGARAVVRRDPYGWAGGVGVKRGGARAGGAGVPCVSHRAHARGLKPAAMLHVVASPPGSPPANDCPYYGREDDIIDPPHRIERGF